MPNEVELKLELAPDAFHRLRTSPWFQALARGAARRKIVSVYFDTDRFDLREEGVSLRIRSIGKKRLQTIKAEAKAGPAFARKEWETKVSGTRPDLKRAKGTALQPLVSKRLKRALQPIFETDIQRTTVPVRNRDSHVELAIDHGWIKNGCDAQPVDEIELELKRGDPAGLVAIAEQLMRDVPVSYGVRSKAERGYALAEGAPVRPVHAEALVLGRRAGAGDGFKAIALSCLRQIALNQEPVRLGDAEGIHQMRVGLRRLRAALSVFKDIVRDERSEDVRTELKWLIGQLGKARDLDVFVKESVVPLPPSEPGVEALRTTLEKKRTAGFDKARRAVESDRYRQLVLKTALWVAGGPWSTTPDRLMSARRQRPIRAFAEGVLARRTKKIVRKAGQMESLDTPSRHKLRIAIKKLRYAAEFFTALFPGAGTKAERQDFADTLERLQNALGKLNDIAVHEQIADIFIHPASHGEPPGRDATFAMGFVSGREHGDIEPLMAEATKAGKRLKKSPRFWD